MAYLLKEHYQNIPCERQRNNSSWSLNFAAQINCIFPIRCQKVKQSRGNYNLQPGPTQFCITIGFQSISILDEGVGGNMQQNELRMVDRRICNSITIYLEP